MFFVGVLALIAGEVAAFIAVGEQIGFWWALFILIVVSAFGPFIVRRVGFGVLGRTRDRLARGEVPGREVLDGLVVLIGGLMICVPGFVGDALGLLLMIRPVRSALIRVSGRNLARRVQRGGRWQVIDVRSHRIGDRPPVPSPPVPSPSVPSPPVLSPPPVPPAPGPTPPPTNPPLPRNPPPAESGGPAEV